MMKKTPPSIPMHIFPFPLLMERALIPDVDVLRSGQWDSRESLQAAWHKPLGGVGQHSDLI